MTEDRVLTLSETARLLRLTESQVRSMAPRHLVRVPPLRPVGL